MRKVDDWVSRLADFVEKDDSVSFFYGESDCALLCLDALSIMTGENCQRFWDEPYKDESDIEEIKKLYGGMAGIGQSVADAVGLVEKMPAFAGRGDMVLFTFAGNTYFGFVSTDPQRICTKGKSGKVLLPRPGCKIFKVWGLE